MLGKNCRQINANFFCYDNKNDDSVAQFSGKRLTYMLKIMDIILHEKIKGLTFDILHYISHKKVIFNSLLFPLNRYYDESKGDCLKCSKCCNDDRDVVESECIEKLGSQSSMICSFHSSVKRCNIKLTPKFVPHSTTKSSQSSAPITSSHKVTVAFNNSNADVGYIEDNINHSGVRNRFASRRGLIITTTMVAVVLFMSGIFIYHVKSRKSRSAKYNRVDSGKCQSRILLVVHCQRPNKYIRED